MKAAFTTLALAVGALGLASPPAQQPGRDAAPRPITGSAVLAGVARVGDADAKPLGGVVVTINHTEKLYGDTVITDERGRFEFRNLPAGRYLLAAEKEGFIRTRYGASRPGRAGTPIALADGQRLPDVTLRLTRGAVLTGRVTNQEGEPAEGTPIALRQFVTIGGERKLVSVPGGGDARTDDLGVYRIWGLPAGEYIVCASMEVGFWHMGSGGAGVHQTTAQDVTWAKSQLQAAASGDRRADAVNPPARPMFGFASVYYPGVLQRAAATVVTLGPGEERAGIDITLQLIPTYRVDGVVVGPDGGAPSHTAAIYLVELGQDSSDAGGVRETFGTRFTFDGVPPGSYALAAMVEDTKEWAMADLTVGAQNASVTLHLQPGLMASGRIAFRGSLPPPADLTRVRVSMSVVGTPGGFAIEPVAATANADGTFQVPGLMAGSYRLGASLAGADAVGPGAGWTMRSATVGGRDIADLPLDIRAGSPTGNIAVAFTDRPTELGGRLEDASGRAASDYFIVVFAIDERAWFPGSRRIAHTRPGNDGHFVVRGLPPGDYLLAALTDVERDEWFDAAFLRELVPKSMKISLGEGEKKTQNIGIAR